MSSQELSEKQGAVVRVKGLPAKATREEVVAFFDSGGIRVPCDSVYFIQKEKRSSGEVRAPVCIGALLGSLHGVGADAVAPGA